MKARTSLVAAGAALAALVLGAPAAVAQTANQPLNSPGRDLPTIDINAALNADTWTNPDVKQEVKPGNLVAFGDSIMANATAGNIGFAMASRNAVASNPNGAQIRTKLNPNINLHGCAQGTPSIPKELASRLNVPLNDYSCPGATVYTNSPVGTLSTQVDQAIGDGALNAQTKYVTLQGGYNDVYNNYMTLTGEGANDDEIARRLGQATQKQLFANAIDPVLDKIKKAAPNAKVTVVGYHTITDDTPAGWQCIYHVGDGYGDQNIWNANMAFPIFFDTMGELNTSKWLQEAAQRHGVNFADERSFSAGHGECTTPDKRWVAGALIDTTTSSHNLALHLTDAGVNAISGDLANKVR